MAVVIEPEHKIEQVQIDGLAALKIIKHCQESLPRMVTGSLLGLTVGTTLEITHSFAFPDPARKSANDDDPAGASSSNADHMDGHEYQLEMMKMLREVNVDNNCVGWYQSMYLGSYSTMSLVENQLSYQTDLSPNAVVLLYDPIQTSSGSSKLKCFRLSDQVVEDLSNGNNTFVKPRNIFEPLPVKFTNPGMVKGVLFDAFHDTQLTSSLDAGTQGYLEKNLELLCQWIDDLAAEQAKFQYFARSIPKSDSKKRGDEAWASPDAPKRFESLLVSKQISNYCQSVDKYAGGGFSKLFLSNGLNTK